MFGAKYLDGVLPETGKNLYHGQSLQQYIRLYSNYSPKSQGVIIETSPGGLTDAILHSSTYWNTNFNLDMLSHLK